MSSTSFIVHRGADGSRLRAILALSILKSLDHGKIEALNSMGIHTVSDLLHWVPVHRARVVRAIARGHIAHDVDLRPFISDADLADDPAALVDRSPALIDGIGAATAQRLAEAFEVNTVGDLAGFAPFLEAESLMKHEAAPFSEDASAPDELIPRAIGAVASTIRFSSMMLDKTVKLSGIQLLSPQGADPVLSSVFVGPSPLSLTVGYVALQNQRWVNMGTHLGEVVHSLALAPGESRNIGIVDWKRTMITRRSEDTTAGETLSADLFHTRALDEVARGVAQEHQWGRTTAVAATGVAGLGAVASGAAVGAAAGGVAGSVSGVGIGAVAGAIIGGVASSESGGWGAIPGLAAGAVVGAAAGAVVGAVGGAVIGGAAGGVGFIMSDSHGDRSVVGEDRQNIMDLTSQKASFVRSLRSTIVLEDTQAESATARTFNVTNYNHSHSLNLTYYEILQKYHVELRTERLEPFVIIPVKPIDFTREIIAAYWDILKWGIPNTALVDAFDKLVNSKGELKLPSQPITDPSQALVTYMEFRLTRPFLSDHPDDNTNVPGRHNCWVEAGAAGGPAMIWQSSGVDNNTNKIDKITTAADFSLPLASIDRVKVQLPPRNVPRPDIWPYSLMLKEARITIPGSPNQVVIQDIDLGTQRTDRFSTRQWDLMYDCKLAQSIEQDQSQQQQVDSYDALNEVMMYIQRRRYLFTRLLLIGIETEQLVDMISSLSLHGSVLGIPVLLKEFVDPVPFAFSSRGILLRMKHMTSAPAAIAALAGYEAELAQWFATALKDRQMTTSDEVFLPSSGVFGEAVLGRSNASEKIDLTRFWNWQDSPIPNSAPAIDAVSTDSRAQATPALQPTVPANVLNIMSAPALPDPTGMTGILAAIQNGNMFRDMSKSEVLAGVMTNLASAAEHAATSAGTLAGQAAEQALKSAVDLAGKVADLAAKVAASVPEQKSSSPAASVPSGTADTMPIESAPTMIASEDPPKNITHEGGRMNARAQRSTPGAPAETSKKDNFDFQYHFKSYDGSLLSGAFTFKYYKDLKTIPTGEMEVVSGLYADILSFERNNDTGTVEITGTPSAGDPGAQQILRGIGSFKLPRDSSSVLMKVNMESTPVKITATSKEEAFHKFQASLEGEAGLPGLLKKIIGIDDFKLKGTVAGETGTTTANETTFEWEVKVPTGRLDVAQVI
jgi:hypothetical protein